MIDIVVNADDFGLDASVNSAIIEAFNKSLIDSATIMANMPGFEEAIELIYENKLTGKIGVHLNLDPAYFLTKNILSSKLFLENEYDEIRKNRWKLIFVTKNTGLKLYEEFNEQIKRVIDRGIKPTHLDTHHHLHEIWPVTKIVIMLLRKYKIPSMRILNNTNVRTTCHKKAYRNAVNYILKKKNINYSDYFGNQIEARRFLLQYRGRKNDKKLEIMVHPVYDDSGKLVDKIGHEKYFLKRYNYSNNE